MLTTSALAETASLVGDPARASMLTALMNGKALTATELARVAGVAPQTASGHLARLGESGLVSIARQGRHRYHRLASPAVAHMLEAIMSVSARDAATRPARVVGPRDKALRRARTCYDHLAGELAVAIADTMVERGHLELSEDGGAVTEAGSGLFRELGMDLGSERGRSRRPGSRVFCRPCLDWSERRPHIAGAVGAALCAHCLSRGWIRPIEGTRAVSVTPAGSLGLLQAFGVRLDG